ncbi:hypothetical protein CI109_104076 [Kwoniella shandongensis]|uniref:Protein AF-9 homolog n=1 Tax=Kwoniella shandongensis TaxID=1734106 RepID=A0A5M6BZ37_9TREE|nr:uncharacterized protein CI109_004038 [Kwoniella shandongensis]KAA5527500.1 hypothetical protein CI109_004038 [Kwoniella shandongensis]
MSTNERVKGIQVHRPIIYGSHARLLTDEEKLTAPPSHTHRWTVFLTSATTPPPPKASSSTDPLPIDLDYIPGGHDDLSYLLRKVTFRLHETYSNPSRVCDKPPFRVTETGWGEFTVQIRIQFSPESAEKPLTLNHPIKLHHWGAPIEAPPSGTTTGAPEGVPPSAPSSSVAPTPAASGTEERGSVKPEPVGTPKPKDESVNGGDDGAIVVDIPGTDGAPTAPTSTQGDDPDGEHDPDTASQIEVDTTQHNSSAVGAFTTVDPNQTLSIASKYPVHAWQYDEIVFSDPPRSFLDILNEHPPTPLPAKNRRPRDQREEHDQRQQHSNKKGKTQNQPRGSLSRRESRAGTMETTAGGVGGGGEGGTPAPATSVPPVTSLPGPGQGALVGIPGEPGSADVPLEFTTEMEKAEWNRLNDARIKIVEQMDKWRERLIAQEKELAKIKEEVKAM